MTIQEIKQAVDNGQTVYWSNGSYTVIKSNDDYLIRCSNGSCIGLTWADGTTLNGREKDFFIKPSK